MPFIKTTSAKDMLQTVRTLIDKHGCHLYGWDSPAQITRGIKAYWRHYPLLNVSHADNGITLQRPAACARPGTLADYEDAKLRFNQPCPKDRPAFIMGFEVEGCVDRAFNEELQRAIMRIYPRGCSVGGDGSIRATGGTIGIEIRTPALATTQALKRLEELLDLLTHASEAGLFHTNSSCGFHVNVSERKTFAWPNKATREQYALTFANRFQPSKWRKAFGRSRNGYCQWARGAAPKTVADLARLVNHYSAINTQNLHLDDEAQRRIEVRVAGNAGYHHHEQMGAFIADVQDAMVEAHAALPDAAPSAPAA